MRSRQRFAKMRMLDNWRNSTPMRISGSRSSRPLRLLGHGVLTAQEAGRAGLGIDDDTVLADAMSAGRTLLTQNRRRFDLRRHNAGLPHQGIIVGTYDPDAEALADSASTRLWPRSPDPAVGCCESTGRRDERHQNERPHVKKPRTRRSRKEPDTPSSASASVSSIQVRGGRVHNLRNIDVDLPRDRLVVLTGVSGPGKSSLAFDTIYAEGQRRTRMRLELRPPVPRPARAARCRPDRGPGADGRD